MSAGESHLDNLVVVPDEYEAPSWGLGPIPEALAEARQGNDNKLWAIAPCGNGDYMSIGANQYIGQWLEDTEAPHAWLFHRPLDLDEKASMFSAVHAAVSAKVRSTEPIRPLKTVTMHIPGEISPYVAVTTLGQPVTNPIKRAIALDLDERPKVVKDAKFNPLQFQPEITLGLEPGVVGPFISLPAAERMRAWYYSRGDSTETTPVEIAMSQRDSLIVQRQSLEGLLADYNRHMLGGYAHVRYIEEQAQAA